MNLLSIPVALFKGLKAIMIFSKYWSTINAMLWCCGIMYVYNAIRALMETLTWYLYAMWYNPNFGVYIPDGIGNFTNTTMFNPVYRLYSQIPARFSIAEIGFILVSMLSISMNVYVFLYIRSMQKSPPEPENADWQRIWKGLGKILEAWRPTVSWDFTLEHLRDPEKLSEYLGQRSKEVNLIWGFAYAYRALYHTILERESFRSEIQAKKEKFQVNSDQSQEAPVTISVAPLEGKKWKRVSMRLEQKEGEAEGEAAEDPGARLSWFNKFVILLSVFHIITSCKAWIILLNVKFTEDYISQRTSRSGISHGTRTLYNLAPRLEFSLSDFSESGKRSSCVA